VGELPRRTAPGNQTHSVVANAIVRAPWDLLFSTIMSFGSGIAETKTDASAGRGFGIERKYVFQPPTKPFLGLGHVFATQNMDFRIEKDFTFVADQHLGLVVDLFNAFGVKNYGCYNGDIPAPGEVNVNFNRPDCAGLGRRLQLGLRYGLQPRAASSTSQSRVRRFEAR
jgi:hypothetical protein